MADLFDLDLPEGRRPRAASEPSPGAPRPLADRLRPSSLDEVVGQEHVLGPEAPLGRMLADGKVGSIIFWGPPGVGKTTIARLLADATDLAFVQVSAIFTGVADLRKIFETAKLRRSNGRGTLLFVDEIHRFNKAQQDAFLPLMEDGTIVLVGATTENPSFELNAALLSRSSVLVLRRLDAAALGQLIARAEAALGHPLPLTGDGREALVEMADGDGRALLNLVEQIAGEADPLDAAALAQRIARRAALFDKSGDEHYNLISALHKSVRGSGDRYPLLVPLRIVTGHRGRIRQQCFRHQQIAGVRHFPIEMKTRPLTYNEYERIVPDAVPDRPVHGRPHESFLRVPRPHRAARISPQPAGRAVAVQRLPPLPERHPRVPAALAPATDTAVPCRTADDSCTGPTATAHCDGPSRS